MSDYYDRRGRPIEMMEWARMGDDRVVKQETVDSYWVSTVHLGIDHSFGSGPPLIFETMVFPAENGEVAGWTELDMRRYSTEAEALAGHREMVELVKTTEWREKNA